MPQVYAPYTASAYIRPAPVYTTQAIFLTDSSLPMPGPTILIVPGAWQTPFHYSVLHSSLASLSHRVFTLSHPSNSLVGPWTASWQDDVANISAAIEREAALGNEVVLVCHSYGGLPGSEACKGLLVGDYAGNAGKGGVKGVVYVSAVALSRGQEIPEAVKRNPDLLVDV
jgi:pimeloyl-ACP methyl ester carboxylesterase